MRSKLTILAGLIVMAAIALTASTAAMGNPPPKLEGPNGEHQVVVCKYVGTPGEDERLQTGNNPIVVDYHALLGDGFDGTFPFEFSDAQGRSLAIRWAANSQDGSIEECPGEQPPKTVRVCDPESGDIIVVPEEDADNYLPVDDPACDNNPPPPPPDKVRVCDPETGEIIEVPENQANQYLPVNDPACKDNPPSPPDDNNPPPDDNNPPPNQPENPPLITTAEAPHTL